MAMKNFLAYFNSFKTMKEYLENDKDINTIDQTEFNHGSFSLSDQEKQIFKQLRSKYNGERERESKFCSQCKLNKVVEDNLCSSCLAKKDKDGSNPCDSCQQ